MALECFIELLGSIFHKTSRGDEELAETFGRLPDCLVIDILSRLPIDSLVRFRSECRNLRALISSQYFTTLHLSRAKPVFLLHDHYKHNKQLYVLFENFDKKDKNVVFENLYLRSELMINKHRGEHPLSLKFSCQGVLLFDSCMRPPATYYILNPITQEEVIVQHTHQSGQLCALYFCSSTRKFKLLYAQVRDSCCQYLVYIFKTRTWRKIRSSSTYNFLPYASPAVVNGALHWIKYADLEKKGLPPNYANNGIIVFRMDKEELSDMPHPGSVCNAVQEHKTMTLSVKENCLSFSHLLFSESKVDIWILEDYETWSWNKRYMVNFFHEILLPFNFSLPMHGWIKLSYIQGGELLLCFSGGYIFLYDLDHKIVKKVKLPRDMILNPFGSYIKSVLAIA